MPKTAGKIRQQAASKYSTKQCLILFVSGVRLSVPLTEGRESGGIAQDVRAELSDIKTASEPLLVRVFWGDSFSRQALLEQLAAIRLELEHSKVIPQEGFVAASSRSGVVVEPLSLLRLLELGYAPAMGQLHDDKAAKADPLDNLSMPQAFDGLASVGASLDELREKLKPILQAHLDSVVRSNAGNPDLFPTLEDKQCFARNLRVLLDRLGFALESPKGHAARLDVTVGGGTKGGGFRFKYRGNSEGGGSQLPPLQLVPKPVDRRLKS